MRFTFRLRLLVHSMSRLFPVHGMSHLFLSEAFSGLKFLIDCQTRDGDIMAAALAARTSCYEFGARPPSTALPISLGSN